MDNGRFTAIVVAVIGVVGTLGGALIVNWDRIVPSKQVTNDKTPAADSASRSSGPASKACIVTLAVPAKNAVLPQRRLDSGKVESVWMFGWHDCPEAGRYHLYVIGPGALNPIVDDDTLTAATYQFRRSSYGVTQRDGWTWKVRAFVDGRWGDWSEARWFSVAAPNQ